MIPLKKLSAPQINADEDDFVERKFISFSISVICFISVQSAGQTFPIDQFNTHPKKLHR
jgi:hypothetical protein